MRGPVMKILLIGTELMKEYGFPPTTEKNSNDRVLVCSDLPEDIYTIYDYVKCFLEAYDDIIVFDANPYCIPRCIDIEKRYKRRLRINPHCIDCIGCRWGHSYKGSSRSFFRDLLYDLMDASSLVLIGFDSDIQPYNMIPLIAKYYGVKLVVVASSHSNYECIADEVIRATGPRYLKEQCRAIRPRYIGNNP